MGCGNSSPTNTDGSSSNPAGPSEASSKQSEDAGPEDDKWKNYGGVYVGFPTDLSNIPQVQIGSLRGGRCGEKDSNYNDEPVLSRWSYTQSDENKTKGLQMFFVTSSSACFDWTLSHRDCEANTTELEHLQLAHT